MIGMDRNTGCQLGTVAHIRQSIADILTTPVGSRVMRREYGSLIPELIDRPGNESTRLLLMAATVHALLRWEPRISLQTVDVTRDVQGGVVLDLEAVDIQTGQLLALNGVPLL